MKTLIATIMTVCMLFNSTLFAADCKWATDITPSGSGYLYTPECHNKVGVTLRDNDDLKVQVTALRKTIATKDLIIEKADERTILWRNESYEQFARLQKEAQYSQTNNMLWFVLGIVVTSAAVYGAGQLK